MFLRLNKYGVISVFDLENEQINKGSYRTNSIKVSYDGIDLNTANYVCTFSFTKNNGDEVNDLVATRYRNINYQDEKYDGFLYLFTSKFLTDIPGELSCTIRLIKGTADDGEIIASTNIKLTVNDNKRTISQVYIDEAQYDAILESLAQKLDLKNGEGTDNRFYNPMLINAIVYANTFILANDSTLHLDSSGFIYGNLNIPSEKSFSLHGDIIIDNPLHNNNPASKKYVDDLENTIKEKANTTVIIDADNITSEFYAEAIKNAYFDNKKPVVMIKKMIDTKYYRLYTCNDVKSDVTDGTRYVCTAYDVQKTDDGFTIKPLIADLSQNNKEDNIFTEGLVEVYSKKVVDSIASNLQDYINQKIADLVGSAPEDLNTIQELVDAFMNADENFTAALNALAQSKVDKTQYDADIGELQQRAGTLISFDPETESMIIEPAPDTLEVEQLLNGKYGGDEQ